MLKPAHLLIPWFLAKVEVASSSLVSRSISFERALPFQVRQLQGIFLTGT